MFIVSFCFSVPFFSELLPFTSASLFFDIFGWNSFHSNHCMQKPIAKVWPQDWWQWRLGSDGNSVTIWLGPKCTWFTSSNWMKSCQVSIRGLDDRFQYACVESQGVLRVSLFLAFVKVFWHFCMALRHSSRPGVLVEIPRGVWKSFWHRVTRWICRECASMALETREFCDCHVHG